MVQAPRRVAVVRRVARRATVRIIAGDRIIRRRTAVGTRVAAPRVAAATAAVAATVAAAAVVAVRVADRRVAARADVNPETRNRK